MIISHIIGGLGNQMFQYAAARALSLQLSDELKLDIASFARYRLHQGFELTRIFNIEAGIANHSDVRKILGWQASVLFRRVLSQPAMRQYRKSSFVVEPQFHYWPEFQNMPRNCYLMGYWQSEKYFSKFEKQLRNDFQFKLPLSVENAALGSEIRSVNAISLHIRRGDYTSNPKNSAIYGLCSLEYYSSAIAHIAKQTISPNFFIFSDDPEWAKNNLKIDFPHQYVTHNIGSESYNDMRLMSLCKHNIIANSSFSWWGAWLNNNEQKLVIAPKNWFINKIDSGDLIPENWHQF